MVFLYAVKNLQEFSVKPIFYTLNHFSLTNGKTKHKQHTHKQHTHTHKIKNKNKNLQKLAKTLKKQPQKKENEYNEIELEFRNFL